MHRKDEQTTDDVYENDDVIKGKTGKEITNSTQGKSSKLTESDCEKIRSSRAALVCLVLLCVLLLTAVIVLCVMFTQERQQLISKNENLTNERDQLRNDYFRIRFLELKICAGWTFYQSSFYYISNEMKSWTESRRYCTERGADLITINNKEEQDFVKNMSGAAVVWIGLTDSAVEGRWKWVDGSTLTSGFWASGEPNSYLGRDEDCAVTVAVPKLPEWPHLLGWIDTECYIAFQWICEMNISQLILP